MYGNLAQTGMAASTGIGIGLAGGTWAGVAAAALAIGILSATRLIMPNAKAKP